MNIKNARFLTSVGDPEKILDLKVPQIVFVGKSNVGKSSLINYLTNVSKLAKTSKDPGKTRLINYFEINKGEYLFVDLPGYGYAKVSKEEKRKWGFLLNAFFLNNIDNIHVFLLIDSRRDATEDDLVMVDLLYSNSVPFTVLATKIDKVKQSEISSRKKNIANSFALGVENIILTSSRNRRGKELILQKITQILEIIKKDVHLNTNEK